MNDEYEVVINSENCDDEYCLFCDSLIKRPEITGISCDECYDVIDN